MFGKEGIPQLILLRLYQRFVGRERTIVFLGQKLISQWSAIRPPGRGATPDLSSGAAYREIRRQPVLSVRPKKFKVQGSKFKVKGKG
jgi:hypothetical protein